MDLQVSNGILCRTVVKTEVSRFRASSRGDEGASFVKRTQGRSWNRQAIGLHQMSPCAREESKSMRGGRRGSGAAPLVPCRIMVRAAFSTGAKSSSVARKQLLTTMESRRPETDSEPAGRHTNQTATRDGADPGRRGEREGVRNVYM
ncbi:hypothetical protein VTO73DRAFT_14941 [Trametes versicolor]